MRSFFRVAAASAVLAAGLALTACGSTDGPRTASPSEAAATSNASTAASGPVMTKDQVLTLMVRDDSGDVGSLKYTTPGGDGSSYWIPAVDYSTSAIQQIPTGTAPASCAETALPLVLASADQKLQHSAIHGGRTVVFGTSLSVEQRVRFFASTSDAKSFYDAYRAKLGDCEKIIVPGDPQRTYLRTYREGPDEDSFVTELEATADGSSQPQRGTTITARIGNAVVTFQNSASFDATESAEPQLDALLANAQAVAKTYD